MDRLTSEHRSKIMSLVRGKDTKPEFAVRRVAHAMGLRYRLHRRDLPGTPDLVFPKHRTAIFVHGCFWHRHPHCRKSNTPKSNVSFWREKFGCVSKVVEIGFGASPSGLSFAAVRPRGQGFRRRLADRGFPIHRLCASGFGRKRGAPRGASALFRDTAARSVF